MALLLRQNNSFEPNIGVLAQQICLKKSAAKFVNEFDFRPLLRCDFQYHCFRLLSVFRAVKKPPSATSTAHFLPSVYIITGNRDFLRNSATTKTLKTQQAVTLENQRCLRYNKIYNTYANRTF